MIKNIITKHMLLSIILVAFLITAALATLVNISWVSGANYQSILVDEHNGIYDLRNIKETKSSLIYLPHGSNYYPNTYLMPNNIEDTVPQSVTFFDEMRADYLSQRFVLYVPDNNKVYNMTFTLSGRHAMRVYANGTLTAQTGQAGLTKKETEVWENNISFNATPLDGKIDIILHSAQFYHAKRGASLASLNMSSNKIITDPHFSERIKGIGIVGALLCSAVLLTGIYFLLSRTSVTLYFALACFTMALREFLQSQAWIYFSIPGNVSFMLEYLSLVLLTIFLSLYLGQYVTSKYLRAIQYTSIIGSLVYGCVILLGDSIFYTSILKYYQILLVVCIVFGVSGFSWKMRNPIREQIPAIFGITVFYFAAIYDIIMYSDILGDSANMPISEIAMLIFMIAQTVSLLQMNNQILADSKQAEQILEAEKNALETINMLKTEFLGNVSHELKTPLTVMSGYAQTTNLLTKQSDVLDKAEVSRRMTLISSEAGRLSLMVNQILDVTRMDEGRMLMDPTLCYVDEIIHNAIQTHYPMLNKNNNRLDIRIDSGLPSIFGDPARISQVIVNLISNAVRFTSEGVITISAKKDADVIIICVSDTGCGITTERIPHLFERYSQKPKTGVGHQDTGTGLGLCICKHIVEQHGGQIWLESKIGEGTYVFFTLPINKN